jgi:predicted tellurium resistance membrane protein TerC
MLEGFGTGDVAFMKEKVLMLNPAGIILLVWAVIELFTDWFSYPHFYTNSGYLETTLFFKGFAIAVLIILNMSEPIKHKLVER